MIAREWVPLLGGALWGIVSTGLTFAGAGQVPERGAVIGLLLYAAGFVPGVLVLRRLPVDNMATLAAGPPRVPLWRLFIPRFWLMMVIMITVGQTLRLFPVSPWLRAGFFLPSASALLCGSLAFLAQALRPGLSPPPSQLTRSYEKAAENPVETRRKDDQMITDATANPLDFERDLDPAELRELELYTQFARKRLEEREESIANLKTAWLAGHPVSRPPLMIPDFPPRLIGADMYDYYTSTVTHYKSYCAFLARFGQDNVSMYTITWEYDFLRQLGGELSRIRHKAPETTRYPISGPEDLKNLPELNYDALVAADSALIRYTHKKLGDLIGPGIYVSLDPFSEVCSLLRKPELLMIDVIDNPQYVHDMCQYMYEVEREVLKRLLDIAPLIVFAPGYTLMLSPNQFKEFALPYTEKLIADFPGVAWMMGSGGNATHLVEPLMRSTAPIPFIDSASDLKRAVELAKEYHKPITVLFPRSVLMRGEREEIRQKTRELLTAAKDVRFLYWPDAILGGDAPNPVIDLFIEAYRDYARYPLEKHLTVEEVTHRPTEGMPKAISPDDIIWESGGEEAFKKAVPFMFRKTVKREVEKMVAAKGITHITAEAFEQAKKEAGF